MSKLELTSTRRSVGIRGKRTRLTIAGTLMVVMVMSMIIPLSGAGAHNGTAVQQSVLSIPSNVLDQNQDTWPTNLTARLVDDGILLNWEAPVEDAASVTGYEILRMRPSKEESDLTALVANTDSTGTTYTDATATEAGVRYFYVVKAVRGSRRSGGTNHGFADVPEYNCGEGGYDPTPVEVEVTAVPIVVQSTADHYFVLYARQQLTVLVEEVPLWMTDGEEDRATSVVDLPVSVTLGQAGTTQLEERVADLPAERYRVERYLISDPADVDGDCFDDITELADPVGRNPVNPAAAIELSVGALVVPDRETFEELSRRRSGAELYYQPDQYPSSNLIEYTKFVLFNMETDRPGVYFMNTSAGMEHRALMEATGLEWNNTIRGELFFHPELVAPDGSRGTYAYRLNPFSSDYSFDLMNRAFTHLAASLPLVDGNFALHLRNPELPYLQDLLPRYRDSRIDLVFDEDVFAETSFQALNPGEGYGLLRLREPDERPLPRDIVIYDALPNNLPRVAGIISTTPQTPLSHVNLRATQDELPNAFIRDALDDADIQSLIGSYVHYTVTEDGWTLRPASPEQVEAHYASSRPSQDRVPERDLSVTSVTPLSDLGFGDWDTFGVKASNLAVLRSLDFPYPPATVPDGFAVPFYFYDEFMKANGFYDDIRDMLADPDFQTDFDVQQDELKKLRKKIKKGDTPGWINAALAEMHAAYPEGTSLRYRSSTNNEDLPGFNGAGLYDSKTQHPEETEEDGISKSLKQVYASLWNFRAFAEREFHRVDHLTTAMGVLVHPNYSNELANGVAVSFNPMFRTLEWYYVNTQVGEDLVTNPEALSVPEELLLRPHGENEVLATSNLLPPGKLLLSESQRAQLHGSLAVIHSSFKSLYNPEPDEPFAMEIEFKITSDDVLAIKQARPWVFNVAAPPSDNVFARGQPIITGTARAGETLTSDVSGIADGNGLDTATFSYQWISNDGTADADITGAVDPTYYVSDDVFGRTLRVRVSFTDDAGHDETVVSRRTDPVQASTNDAATGLPAISGVTREGKTLTADVSSISDDDGLTNSTFSYQWITNDGTTDSDIDGATASTYAIQTTDVGKAIKVRVSFTDDAGNHESLTSVGMAVSAAEQRDRPHGLRANAAEGAITLTWQDPITHPSLGIYQILRHRPELGETGPVIYVQYAFADDRTYTDSAVEPGMLYAYAVKAVKDPFGYLGPASDPVQVRVPSADSQGPAQPNNPASGAPTTSGTVQVGEGLTAGTSSIVDDDGLTNATFDYQWVRIDRGTDTDIDGATGASYTLVREDEGATVKVRVSFADDAGHEETLTSAATATVEPAPNRPATGQPTIGGAIQVGGILTASTSGIADEDGLTNATFAFQWIRTDDSTDTQIAGATGDSYTLVNADKGKTVKVRVSFTDDADNEEALTSAATATIAPPPLTASFHTDDTPESHDGSADFTFELRFSEEFSLGYVTLRDYAFTINGGAIDNANRVSPPSNLRWRITVQPASDADVSITLAIATNCNDDGAICTADSRMLSNQLELTVRGPASVSSTPTNTPATGVPTISGTLQVSETLQTSTSGIADDNGLTNVAFAYQWVRVDGTTETDIGGATGFSYALTETDQGHGVKVRVSFTDDAGHEENLTSAATAPVGPKSNSPATGQPTISGTERVRETLTASASGITDENGLSNVSYGYQWVRTDSGTDTDISGATGASYTLVEDDTGKTIKVRVAFTDDDGYHESVTSAGVYIPKPPLTAQLDTDHTSHDGQTAFTVNVTFSEQFPLSYKTVRDHLLDVTDGSVESVKRDAPEADDRDRVWDIKVTPAGDNNVVIRIRPTTDCNDQGAICTADDRMLSNQQELTVEGP